MALYPSLRLPVLRDTVLNEQTCEGRDSCSTCPLHNVFCLGPGSDRRDSCGEMYSCNTECGTCHGDITARTMTGVCCKSPLAPWAIERIQTLKEIKLPTVPQLRFPDERIPIIMDDRHGSPAPVNAISLRRIYSKRNGWRSRDIKDFLKLDKKTTLILLTVMKDNYLDDFMEMPWYAGVKEVGFTYWQPLLFSIFTNESLMQRLLSFWRIMRNLADSGAHMLPCPLNMHRLMLDDYFLASSKLIPNVFFNLSQGSEQVEFNMRIYGYLKRYAAIYGKNVTWMFQGVSHPARRKAVRSLLPAGALCYFFITPLTGARRSDDQYGWYSRK